jgi:hypothetical protein
VSEPDVVVLSNEELIKELIRVRFLMMRINGVLASEKRINHTLIVVENLVDEEIRRIAPEGE